MATMRQARFELDQENPEGVRRHGMLMHKTPGGIKPARAGLSTTTAGKNRLARSVNEPVQLKQATDIAPQRLFKENLTARKVLLQDKTNKTPHPSTRRPEAGPSKAADVTPAKLERAQLVPDAVELPPPMADPAALLSPLPLARPDYSSVKTPSPDHAARLRAEQAPYTPEPLTFPEKEIHPADARRAVEWETLEEREVEYAGPTAIIPDAPGCAEPWSFDITNLHEELHSLPFIAPQPFPSNWEPIEYGVDRILQDLGIPDLDSDDGRSEVTDSDYERDEVVTPARPSPPPPSKASAAGASASGKASLRKPSTLLRQPVASTSATSRKMPPPAQPASTVRRPPTAAADQAKPRAVPSFMRPTTASKAKLAAPASALPTPPTPSSRLGPSTSKSSLRALKSSAPLAAPPSTTTTAAAAPAKPEPTEVVKPKVKRMRKRFFGCMTAEEAAEEEEARRDEEELERAMAESMAELAARVEAAPKVDGQTMLMEMMRDLQLLDAADEVVATEG